MNASIEPESIALNQKSSSETLSVGSVDIFKLISRKNASTTVPLCMEKSDEVDNHHSDFDLSYCLEKINAAKLVLEDMEDLDKYGTIVRDEYTKSCDKIRAGSMNQHQEPPISDSISDSERSSISIDQQPPISESDSERSSISIDSRKSRNDLIAQTFSAGCVDICQVIRSNVPPTLPLRMELNCDGFETVRTKRKAIEKCMKKADNANTKSKNQRNINKPNAISYDEYNKSCDQIRAGRMNQHQDPPISDSDSERSLMSIDSRKSRNDLIAQTFSAGCVDICQVIRSNVPPTLPLRMELNCDGFETVRTKRKAIEKCVKKFDDTRNKLAQDTVTGIQYASYIETLQRFTDEQKQKSKTLRRDMTCPVTISENNVNANEKAEKGCDYDTDNTEKTLQSSCEWTSNNSCSISHCTITPSSPDLSIHSPIGINNAITNVEERTDIKKHYTPKCDKNHVLLINNSAISEKSEPSTVVVGKTLSHLSQTTIQKVERKSITDRYCSSISAFNPESSNETERGIKSTMSTEESIIDTNEDQFVYNDFSYSMASTVKTLTSCDELLSYDTDSKEGLKKSTSNNSNSEMGLSIRTTSVHLDLTKQVHITFSSGDSNGISESSSLPFDSMNSPEESEQHFLLGRSDDQMQDEHEIVEKGWKESESEDESSLTDRLISLHNHASANTGENHMLSKRYHEKVETEQYHYVNEKFTFRRSNRDEDFIKDKESPRANNYSWPITTSFNDEKGKRRKDRMKSQCSTGINEIVFSCN